MKGSMTEMDGKVRLANHSHEEGHMNNGYQYTNGHLDPDHQLTPPLNSPAKDSDRVPPTHSEEPAMVAPPEENHKQRLVVSLTNGHAEVNGGDGVVNFAYEDNEENLSDKGTVSSDDTAVAENGKNHVPRAEDTCKGESDGLGTFAGRGQLLNSGVTEITIPEDALINYNTGRVRAKKKKSKEEKIPMEPVLPVINDTNSVKDKSDGLTVVPVSSEKLAQQINGTRKSFEEYFIPVNTHKKFLRREKLYLTKEHRKGCQGWKRVIICGLIAIVIATAILVGVLAATGILIESDSKSNLHPQRGLQLPNQASISQDSTSIRPRLTSLSTLSYKPPVLSTSQFFSVATESVSNAPSHSSFITQVPTTVESTTGTSPVMPTTLEVITRVPHILENKSHPHPHNVPNMLIGEFKIVNKEFSESLQDNSSYLYINLAGEIEQELRRLLQEQGSNDSSISIVKFSPGSVIVKFAVVLKEPLEGVSAQQATDLLQSYLQKHNSYLASSLVDQSSVVFKEVLNECDVQNGHCSHTCTWNYTVKICSCPDGFTLMDDGLTCKGDSKEPTSSQLIPVTSAIAIDTSTTAKSSTNSGTTEVAIENISTIGLATITTKVTTNEPKDEFTTRTISVPDSKETPFIGNASLSTDNVPVINETDVSSQSVSSVFTTTAETFAETTSTPYSAASVTVNDEQTTLKVVNSTEIQDISTNISTEKSSSIILRTENELVTENITMSVHATSTNHEEISTITTQTSNFITDTSSLTPKKDSRKNDDDLLDKNITSVSPMLPTQNITETVQNGSVTDFPTTLDFSTESNIHNETLDSMKNSTDNETTVSETSSVTTALSDMNSDNLLTTTTEIQSKLSESTAPSSVTATLIEVSTDRLTTTSETKHFSGSSVSDVSTQTSNIYNTNNITTFPFTPELANKTQSTDEVPFTLTKQNTGDTELTTAPVIESSSRIINDSVDNVTETNINHENETSLTVTEVSNIELKNKSIYITTSSISVDPDNNVTDNPLIDNNTSTSPVMLVTNLSQSSEIISTETANAETEESIITSEYSTNTNGVTNDTMTNSSTDNILDNNATEQQLTTLSGLYNVTINNNFTTFSNESEMTETTTRSYFTDSDNFTDNENNITTMDYSTVSDEINGTVSPIFAENSTDPALLNSTFDNTFNIRDANSPASEVNSTENATLCGENEFTCPDDTVCHKDEYMCDGVPDCADGWDESICEETCYKNFKCPNTTKCITAKAHCDGLWDCPDGSDEVGCNPSECARHEVMCLDGSACIRPLDICDRHYNCHDRSDEVGCVERSTCEAYPRFYCPDGLCIPLELKCDDSNDCKDNEDQANCTCSKGEFKCFDGKCINMDLRCDGQQHCRDGSDEIGCVQVDSNGFVEVFEPVSGQWGLLCGEDWTLEDAHHLCQELGFRKAESYGVSHVSTNSTAWMNLNRENVTSPVFFWTERIYTSTDSCASQMAATVVCEVHECGNFSGLLFRRRRKRIVDGQPASLSKWPFISVTYNVQSKKGCLSEILSPVWLITSAECLLSAGTTQHNGSDWFVRTSSGNPSGNQNEITHDHEILKIDLHPHSSKFRSRILRDYDLALIRLKYPLEFNNYIGAICLPEEEVQPGITCFAGAVGSHKPRSSPPEPLALSHLAVGVLERERCNEPQHYNSQVSNKMLCAKGSDTQTLCDNDEGAPLMCLSSPNIWHLAGILTYQRWCGIYNWQPSIFSNLFAMKDFIEYFTRKKQYLVPYDQSHYIIQPVTEPSTTSTEFNVTETLNETITETPVFNATETLNVRLDSRSTAVGEQAYDASNVTETPVTESYVDEVNVTTSIISETVLVGTTTDGTSLDMSASKELTTTATSVSQDSQTSNMTLRMLSDGPSSHLSYSPHTPSLSTTVTQSDMLVSSVTTLSSETASEDLGYLSTVSQMTPKDEETLQTISDSATTAVSIETTLPREAIENDKVSKSSPHLQTEEIIPHSSNAKEGLTDTSSTIQVDQVTKNNSEESELPFTSITPESVILSSEVPVSKESSPKFESLRQEIPNLQAQVIGTFGTESSEGDFKTTTLVTSPEMLSDSFENPHTNFARSFGHDVTLPKESEDKELSDVTDKVSDTQNESPLNIQSKNDEALSRASQIDEEVTTGSLTVPKSETSSEISVSTLTSQGQDLNLLGHDATTESSFNVDLTGGTGTSIVTEKTPSFASSTQQNTFHTTDDTTYTTLPSTLMTTIEILSSAEPGTQSAIDGVATAAVPTEIPTVEESQECGTWNMDQLQYDNETSVQWPSVGLLQNLENLTTLCTVNIISPMWVLASLDCLTQSDPSLNASMWIFVDSLVQDESSIRGLVNQIIYQSGVALVQLQTFLRTKPYSSAICIPHHETKPSQHCIAVGWKRSSTGKNYSQYIYDILNASKNCNTSTEELSNSFCVDIDTDVCVDDLGAPIMCVGENRRWELQGILTLPQNCSRPTVYTNISPLTDWIEATVANSIIPVTLL